MVVKANIEQRVLCEWEDHVVWKEVTPLGPVAMLKPIDQPWLPTTSRIARMPPSISKSYNQQLLILHTTKMVKIIIQIVFRRIYPALI